MGNGDAMIYVFLQNCLQVPKVSPKDFQFQFPEITENAQPLLHFFDENYNI